MLAKFYTSLTINMEVVMWDILPRTHMSTTIVTKVKCASLNTEPGTSLINTLTPLRRIQHKLYHFRYLERATVT